MLRSVKVASECGLHYVQYIHIARTACGVRVQLPGGPGPRGARQAHLRERAAPAAAAGECGLEAGEGEGGEGE